MATAKNKERHSRDANTLNVVGEGLVTIRTKDTEYHGDIITPEGDEFVLKTGAGEEVIRLNKSDVEGVPELAPGVPYTHFGDGGPLDASWHGGKAGEHESEPTRRFGDNETPYNPSNVQQRQQHIKVSEEQSRINREVK